MRRGELWTIAGEEQRAVIIVQDDIFDATDSVTVCALTEDRIEAPLFRVPLAPNPHNGLSAASFLMVDRIATVAKTRLDTRLGRLGDEDVLKLNQAMLVFLGLAISPKGKPRV